MSKADELKKLKNLYDEGILTEDEYLSEKNKLLNIEETQRNENSLNDSTPQNFINSQPNIDTSHLNISYLHRLHMVYLKFLKNVLYQWFLL